MRIVYRQTQEIPFEKWLQELELERKTDEEEARLGHPLPRRFRYFSGSEHSQTRVHERTYEDFENFGKMFEAWADDEVCQKLEVDRHNYYVCDLAPKNWTSYNVRKKKKRLTKELKEDGKKELHSRADHRQAAGSRTALQPGQNDYRGL